MEASFVPFAVLAEDVARLDACEAFQSIRRNAASQHGISFCHDHDALGSEDRDAWLLHRDIVHALILPVLRIHGQASRLADFILRPNTAVDRELAFRGEARGAFSWLQCLLSDEVDFSCTEGCPACVVTHVLHSEPTIRLTLVASLIPQSVNSSDGSRPNLPTFEFWLESLRTALDTDPFWGAGYWADIEARARSLEKGIQDLLRQCRALEDLVTYNKQKVGKRTVSADNGRMTLRNSSTTMDGCHLSPLARRQLMLVAEEQAWMRSIILSCWKTLLAEEGSLTQRSVAHAEARSSTS